MLDLSRFFILVAQILLNRPRKKRRDWLKLNESFRTRARQSRRQEEDLHDKVRKQLERALTWSENNLRNTCFLAEEGTEDTWRELLKAMIFDRCLQS